jgi:biopolymer transport protein ExbD
MAKKRRANPEINASSMADIAFLLLIFFLVTTTIDTDKGIRVKLPEWSDIPPPNIKMNERNVFSVLVNANNELLVRGELMEKSVLREKAKEFIMNPQGSPDLAEKPTRAVISLKNDRGTEYETYLTVYNELKAAYNEIWEEQSQAKFGRSFADLPSDKQKEIRAEVPLVISEAEPTKFGEEK